MDWLFQCNPKRYDLESAIEHGGDESWAMNQHKNEASPGDRVFFWQTGADACLRAIGRITSPIFERPGSRFGSHGVSVVYDFAVLPPLTRQEIQDDAILSRFRPFTWAMGTNIPIPDPNVVSALYEALQARLKPVGAASSIQTTDLDQQKDLDSAIKRATKETIHALMHQVAEMDPTAFEWLIRALLIKLGYTNVVVTKQSGDGGIDVTATLIAGGITNIQTAIQAKRTRSVGRPVIQALRGSLHAHQTGLVITSGRFAENALEDAADQGKAAIACIDGTKLVELLLEHSIGAERKMAAIYTLRLEDLTLENLQAMAE